MQDPDLDKHIKEIATMISQGLQFDSEKEAERHVDNTAAKLQTMLQQSSAMFQEGLRYITEARQAPVSDITHGLLNNLHKPDRINDIINKRIVKDPGSLAMFSEVVNSYYGCGDFHKEECMIAVLLTLFPMEPQPFACYGTLIWRRDGIAEAQRFYEHIADLFESPIIDYFAADCHYKAGNKSEARRLLLRGQQNAEKDLETYAEVVQFIRVMLHDFNPD